MLKRLSSIVLINFVFLLAFSSLVFADTYEYVTHGGYDAAVEAWKRVALLFNTNSFLGLFSVSFIAGLLFLLIATFLKAAFGLKVSPQIFLPYLIIGGLIYGALIVPKDDIVIYDETLNRGPYTVSGIPRGLAFIAGNLNKIERGAIELISTSGDPIEDYRLNPAGLVFNAFGSMNGKQVPYYIFQSLKNYFSECIIVEMEREGATLNMEQILRGEKTLVDAIKDARNPALYVTIYDSAGGEQTVTCEQAGDTVLGYVNQFSNLENIFKGGCAKVGYDSSSITSYQQCRNMISNAADFLLQKAGVATGGITDTLLAQQLLFSEIIKDYVLTNGPSAVGSYLATVRTTGSFIGLGIHANSWIPEMKEALTSIIISLSPLILLFVITPLAGRAISVLAGFFIWLTVWGIVDAMIHSFGLSMAGQYAKYINVGGGMQGIGIYAASVLPNVTGKIYALYGALRWSGLALSSVLSMMLVRFGGAALTMVASQIASLPMSSGASIGQGMVTNPMGTVLSSFTSSQAFANMGYAMGGTRNVAEYMIKAEEAKVGEQLAKGMSWESYLRSRGNDLGKVISDLGYSQLQAMRKGYGEATKLEVFEREFGQLAKKVGFQLTSEQIEQIYARSQGNIGKAYQMMGTLAALKYLSDAGYIDLTKEQKQILEKGDLMQQLTLAEKIREAGGMQVMYIGGKNGADLFATYITPDRGGHLSFIIGKDGIKLADFKAHKISFSQDEAWKYLDRLGYTDEKTLQTNWEKVLNSSDTSKIAKEFKNTHSEEYIKAVEKAIEEIVSKDKAMADYLKQEGLTVHELAVAVGARMQAGFEFMGSGGGFYADASYNYQNLSKSAQGREILEKVTNALKNSYSNIERQVTKNTFEKMQAKGFSHEEMEQYLNKVGATELEKISEVQSLEKSLGIGSNISYDALFGVWYAQKNNISILEAWRTLIGKSPEELVELKKEFMEDLINNTERFKSIQNYFNQKKEEIETQINDVKQQVQEKIPEEGNVSEKVKKELQDVEIKSVHTTPLFPFRNNAEKVIEEEKAKMQDFNFWHSIPIFGAPPLQGITKGIVKAAQTPATDEEITALTKGIVRSSGLIDPTEKPEISTQQPQEQKSFFEKVDLEEPKATLGQQNIPTSKGTKIDWKNIQEINFNQQENDSNNDVNSSIPVSSTNEKLREIIAKRRI